MKLSTVSPLRCETIAPQPACARHFDGRDRLAQGADLVQLDQHGVGRLFLDAALDALDVGDEEVVADQLDLVADLAVQELPAVPVVLGQAVLQDDDAGIFSPSRPTWRPSARK